MLNNYDYLISKCPWWLNKNYNIQSFYKAVSKLFDEIDYIYNLLEKQYLIDYANNEFLDYLGNKFNVERNNQNDERYRNRIKLKMKQINLLPNIETLYEIGKMFSGIVPKIETNVNNEPAMYEVKFIGNKDYDYSLIDDLKLNSIVGGGIKVNSKKCIDNYSLGVRFGNGFLGTNRIKTEVKQNAICDFDYLRYGNFGNNRLGQFDLSKKYKLNIR